MRQIKQSDCPDEALRFLTVRRNTLECQSCRPGRIEGVRKIAVRFGVDPSTVQKISRPFGRETQASSHETALAVCGKTRQRQGRM